MTHRRNSTLWIVAPLLIVGGLLLFVPRPALTVDCPPCDDGQFCTVDACDTTSGTCTHVPLVCPPDGNQCTEEICVESSDACIPFPRSRQVCDDGNACTLNDECIGTTCVSGNIPLICNDNNVCTSDSCNSQTGCVFAPASGGCNDGNACTGGDTCVAGQCQPGTPVTCNDGNECTSDSCNSQTGCGHLDISGPCDDGSACTSDDQCIAGTCVGTAACGCLDQDGDGYSVCTLPGCDPAGVLCGDCDDSRPEIHPGASEACNHADDDCDGAVDEGSAKVWSDTPITDPGGAAGDRFGAAIAEVGDLNGDGVPDLAFGAPGADTPRGDDAGAVVLMSGADRSFLCRAVDPAGNPGDQLGFSVAAIGDLDGDGVPDVAAGEPGGTGANGTGRAVLISGATCAVLRSCGDSVFVFRNEGQIQSYRDLGSSIAAIGDVNGDGIDDVAAGDPSALGGNQFVLAFANGRVTIFSGANCAVLRRLQPLSLAQDQIRFGTWLANLGDLTGDGHDDLGIGSLKSPDLQDLPFGKLQVYSSATSSYPMGAADLDPQASSGQFSSAFAPVPDISGDGIPDIAVGEPLGDAAGLADAGVVVLVSGANGSVLRRCAVPGAAAGDQYGRGVAALSDQTGDGRAEIAVAAPNDDTSAGIDAGSIAVLSSADCSLVTRLEAGDASAGDFLGDHALIATADLTDDPGGELIAGRGNGTIGPGIPARPAVLFSPEADCDGDGVTPSAGDCNDASAASHPGAEEICDGLDNDCDEAVDEGVTGGGAACDTGQPGVCAAGTSSCSGGSFTCLRNQDPSTEICDGLDNDCNGQLDDIPPNTDNDGVSDCIDNCVGFPNPDQADEDGDGLGDACDPCPHFPEPDLCVCFQCRVEDVIIDNGPAGTGIVRWTADMEFDLVGYNVITYDNKGFRVQINPAVIPCQECNSARPVTYTVTIPKHKSGRNIFVEQVTIFGTVRTYGPAVKP